MLCCECWLCCMHFLCNVRLEETSGTIYDHCAKKPVTTMLTYRWKCTVLHCNHLGNTWKPLVLMTYHFDYHPRYRSGNNQRVGSSAPVVSRCFPGGYNVKLYISRGRLAWWLLAFLCCGCGHYVICKDVRHVWIHSYWSECFFIKIFNLLVNMLYCYL